MDIVKFVTGLTPTSWDATRSYKSIRICSGIMESWGCHQPTRRGGLSVCAWRGLQNLPYSLTLKCPIRHLFYGRFTHALSDAEREFYQRGNNKRNWLWKVSRLQQVFDTRSDSSRSFSKTERIKENWWRELTLNFLMFHEVTKPYEQEKNARVQMVFQHPKHDGEAKWTTYLTRAAQK